MGLPPGWVTDPNLALSYTQQLAALGNGVLPAQAATALRDLLQDAR
jgi:DNA (cytosine-5)-methyltransferase 1